MLSNRYFSGTRPLAPSLTLPLGIMAAALFVVSGLIGLFPVRTLALGFCLPSPDMWPIGLTVGWVINTALLLGCAGAWVFLNKEFTLVKGIDRLTLLAFLVLVGSNPFCTDHLTTGSILLTVTVLCLAILFGASHERNCTHQIFVIYTFLAVGSMFQYAFVPMMVVFLVSAIIMKTMRTKEVMAMILGIIAPYWVGIGLGLLPIESFHLPEVSFLFRDFSPSVRMITLLVNISFSILLAVILCVSNSMVIFAGNKETRARNNVISLLIFTTAAFVVFNFNNMDAYLPTFYFALAVQVGNLFAYHNLPWRRTLLWTFASLYVAGFIIMCVYP